MTDADANNSKGLAENGNKCQYGREQCRFLSPSLHELCLHGEVIRAGRTRCSSDFSSMYLEKLAADQNCDGSANHIGTVYRSLAVGLRQDVARPSDVWNLPGYLSNRINCSSRNISEIIMHVTR